MATSSQPLVSIVTPVYNTATFLPECIESVLAQTYKNWEYTIVDNCSTDGTREIAHRYAERDPRIRVHDNTTFLGAVQNFNSAMRRISPESEYCKVVFADDWIFPECLERMVATGEAHPSVGLVSAYCLEGTHVICAGLPYSSTVVSGREICRRHLLEKLYLFGSANTVLYRADLVRMRDPFYNEANIHSDTEVCFDLLKSSDFGFVHQVLTFTRVRPGSLTTMSTDMYTYLSGMLHVIVTYGRDYLTAQEFDSFLDAHLSDYYRCLVKSALKGRDTQFWRYHKGEMAQAGYPFSFPRMAREGLAGLAEAFGRTFQKLARVRRA